MVCMRQTRLPPWHFSAEPKGGCPSVVSLTIYGETRHSDKLWLLRKVSRYSVVYLDTYTWESLLYCWWSVRTGYGTYYPTNVVNGAVYYGLTGEISFGG